jgi:glutamate racemase
MHPLEERPIGMFDSGIGGLTVLNAIHELLPKEKLVYFADTARLPYGDKSAETVLRYSIENSIFLMEHWIKLLVIACNTASSVAVDKLRQLFNIPVIGVIEPGAKTAVSVSKSGRIAVLGTRGTIQSGAYQREILKINPHAHIELIACPLFVPLIEEGLHDHAATRLIVQDYLAPLQKTPIDTILLGCTHYLALADIIRETLDRDVEIVDSASTCAEHVSCVLHEKSLATASKETATPLYYASDNPEKFRKLGQKFMTKNLGEVKVPASSGSHR